MTYDPHDRKLVEIKNRLSHLSPEEMDKVLDWIKKGNQSTTNLKKSFKNLSDSLDTIRVLVQYMMFDLEATRREKTELQHEVETFRQLLIALDQDADTSSGSMMNQPPEEIIEIDENGLIDLPETGDFIHNSECNHPYDCDCYCNHCEAFRERMSLDDGAD